MPWTSDSGEGGFFTKPSAPETPEGCTYNPWGRNWWLNGWNEQAAAYEEWERQGRRNRDGLDDDDTVHVKPHRRGPKKPKRKGWLS